MKKLISIILIIVVLACIVPASAEEEELSYGDFRYQIEPSGSITLTRYVGDDTDVVIPQRIDGRPVTKIGWDFNVCDGLKNVVIPEGIKVIEYAAFCCSTELETVSLPKSITLIEIDAFGGCSSLKTVKYNGTEEMWNNLPVVYEYYDDDNNTLKLQTNDELKNAENHIFSEISYSDVKPGAWYEDAVYAATNKLCMTGVSEDRFAPEANMTRAMFVTALRRLNGEARDVYTENFSDVTADWCRGAVAWAKKYGIVNGTSETTFSPNALITREQAVTILYRFANDTNRLNKQKYDTDMAARADLSKFADAGKVSDWAKEAMSWAVADGVIKGIEKNGKTFLDPKGTATRAEVAEIIVRCSEKYKTPKFILDDFSNEYLFDI